MANGPRGSKGRRSGTNGAPSSARSGTSWTDMCRMLGVVSRKPAPVDTLMAFRQLADTGRNYRDFGCPQPNPKSGHPDGWGIACLGAEGEFYARSAAKATVDPKYEEAVKRLVRVCSPPLSLLVHLRYASKRDTIQEQYAHPFRREVDGRVTFFAHNGEIEGFGLQDGKIDTQLIYDRFLDSLGTEARPLPEFKQAVAKAKAAIDAEFPRKVESYTFLMLDGVRLIRDYSRAEIVCEDCGLVLDDMIIDEGPEWRAFDSEQRESRERAGPPSTIMAHDKGLSTSIGWRNKDAYGRQIPHKSRAQIYRLRKWQHRIRTSKSGERSLAQGLTEINTMASKMGLPRHVRENAAVLYRRASTKNLVRGRSIDEVVAATLYASCRQSGVPRTLDEIASKSSVDRKSIGRTYRTLVRELGLKLLPQSPRDYIARFCNRLELDMDVQRKAKEILDKVE